MCRCSHLVTSYLWGQLGLSTSLQTHKSTVLCFYVWITRCSPPRPPLTTACCGAARGGRVAVSGPRPRCWPRRCCCCLLAALHRGSDRTGSAIERKYAGHSRHSPEWTADSRYLLTVFSFHLSLPKQCQGYQTHSQQWLTIHIAESEQSQW